MNSSFCPAFCLQVAISYSSECYALMFLCVWIRSFHFIGEHTNNYASERQYIFSLYLYEWGQTVIVHSKMWHISFCYTCGITESWWYVWVAEHAVSHHNHKILIYTQWKKPPLAKSEKRKNWASTFCVRTWQSGDRTSWGEFRLFWYHQVLLYRIRI
jgi:hypothetical protein